MTRGALRSMLAGLVLACLAAGAGAAVDPFHLALERDARSAALRGAAAEAARLYRIACFGMLDEPMRLGACTVRLALAQHDAGDREGFAATWNRLATLEERFQGLSRADVDDAERRALAAAAGEWLNAETVRAIPGLADLLAASRSPAAEAEKPPARRAKPSPLPEPEPEPEAESATIESSPPPSAEAPPVASPPPAASAPPAPAAPSDEELSRLEAARDLLTGAPTREQLAQAIAATRPIADAWPAEPAHARLVGDLAYRAGDWTTCAEYHRRAGEPGLGEPLARFYMAVCLYETGDRGEAAELLTPVAARLRPTPFVSSYLEKILGASSLP